jgi:hypothetical protein
MQNLRVHGEVVSPLTHLRSAAATLVLNTLVSLESELEPTVVIIRRCGL